MDFKPQIKVCGLTRMKDLEEIIRLGVDYAGFIFYEKTKRFAEGKINPVEVKKVEEIKKVGVFVNATEDYIQRQVENYGLDLLQLHGGENPAFCKKLRKQLPVLKVFKIKDEKDLKETEAYKDACDYFLFDTAGNLHGGNGRLFDWEILKHYRGETPFFLSGGIGPGEEPALKKFKHPQWMAIDINSRFEDAPGVKNTERIKQFLWDLNIS